MGGAWLLMIVLTLGIGVGTVISNRDLLFTRSSISNKTLDDLIKMKFYDFETVVANYYRSQGYHVTQTKKTNDGGKDLIMMKGGQLYYVECKKNARSNSVGRPVIQKLVGAAHPVKAKTICVTTSKFSSGAVAEARRSNVKLVDGNQLMRMLK